MRADHVVYCGSIGWGWVRPSAVDPGWSGENEKANIPTEKIVQNRRASQNPTHYHISTTTVYHCSQNRI